VNGGGTFFYQHSEKMEEPTGKGRYECMQISNCQRSECNNFCINFYVLLGPFTGLLSGGNVFSSTNMALYGPFWATHGTTLAAPNNTFNITRYNADTSPPLSVNLIDYYGQRVLSEANGNSQIVVLRVVPDPTCFGTDGYVV
jgi:hypothetical protein